MTRPYGATVGLFLGFFVFGPALAAITLQVPDAKDYENPWQWVAGSVFIVALGAITYLFKENSKLRDREFEGEKTRGANYKTQAETCLSDLGKTSEALQVSNSSIVVLIGKIEGIIASQEKLNDKLDRNWERMGGFASRMDRFQAVLERVSPGSMRDGS